MIQRIQSIYLLAVTILMIVCMCNPVGTLIANTQEISEFGNLCITFPDGTKDYATWALFGILLIVALLSFGTIFLFKKRMHDSRNVVHTFLADIGYVNVFVRRELEALGFRALFKRLARLGGGGG